MADYPPVQDSASGARVQQERRWPWRVCAVVAVILLFVGNLEAWAYPNIADTSTFVDTTREVLGRENVREAVATRVIDSLLLDYPDLQARIGDTLIAIVTGLFGSEAFQEVFSGVAAQLHRALVHGDPIGVVIESPELRAIVQAVARNLAPEQTVSLAIDDGPLRIELFSDAVIPSYESEITILRWAGIAAGLVGLLLVALPYAVRRDRWSVRLAGLTLLATALLTFLVVNLASWIVGRQVSDPQARTVIAEIIDGFTGWLAVQTFVVLLIGMGLTIYGLLQWPSQKRLALEPA